MCDFLDICPEEEIIYVDLEGIQYHPDTNVSMKVIDSVMADILALTLKGFHSIAVVRGKGKLHSITYRMAGCPTIWEELAKKCSQAPLFLDYTPQEVRDRIVVGTKQNDKYNMEMKLTNKLGA